MKETLERTFESKNAVYTLLGQLVFEHFLHIGFAEFFRIVAYLIKQSLLCQNPKTFSSAFII
jgi:hypothetical protein